MAEGEEEEEEGEEEEVIKACKFTILEVLGEFLLYYHTLCSALSLHIEPTDSMIACMC